MPSLPRQPGRRNPPRSVRSVRDDGAPGAPPPAPVALYYRVSTEDQAERQTIAAQQDFLRRTWPRYPTPRWRWCWRCAHVRDGIPEDVQRIVAENAKTLKFEPFEFEEEEA